MAKNMTEYPVLAPLYGIMGVIALVGCSVTFPSGKFHCGKNRECPPNLYCHQDNICRDTPDRGADNGDQESAIGDPDSGPEYADQNGAKRSEIEGSAGAGAGGVTIRGDGQGGKGKTTIKQPVSRAGAGGKGGAIPGGAGANGAVTGMTCGDETCTDPATGLEWQKCTDALSGTSCSEGSPKPYVWDSAITRCDDLIWAGKDDWRLPSIQELVTIVDYSTSDPAINTKVFPPTPALGFWSSSSFIAPSNPPYAWGIDFTSGYIAYDDRTIYRTDGYLVRCVRGEPLIRDFTNDIKGNDLVVNDKAASLMWQGCAAELSGPGCAGVARSLNWEEANDYCNQLTYANYTDWRLPTIRELVSIVDYTTYLPAIDKAKFPATPTNAPYWSSTPIFNQATLAWSVYFDYGRTKYEKTNTIGPIVLGADSSAADKRNLYLIRCVKDLPTDK